MKLINKQKMTKQKESILNHLAELRSRLIKYFVSVVIIFIVSIPFANNIYYFFTWPMPPNIQMIATEVTSPLLVPIKLNFYLSLIITLPYLFFHAWGFAMPGLYQKERKLIKPILISTICMFALGMVFAYFIVAPLVINFLFGIAPNNVNIMTDINHYLSFMLKLLFAFGLAFEVPIATFIVVRSGLRTFEQVRAYRPYLIVAFLVTGMILTPPDVISQLFLALPMWALFEIGLLLSKD
tara:strand:+ start:39428 stop:40144 length:717 start_codon:yes stop_codon:yes gene_type:complete